jgi:hypothetical protein
VNFTFTKKKKKKRITLISRNRLNKISCAVKLKDHH